MIFWWFFWRFFKLAVIVSSLLTLFFLFFQLVKLDQILFQLPVRESLSFLFAWFFYHFLYLLPMALFLSFSLRFFELKENKKLSVLQSFGLDPKSLYLRSLLLLLPVMFSLLLSYFLLGQEDLRAIRKQLTLQYYALIITSVPPGSFHNFGEFTLHVESREGEHLKGIFFKFREGVVIAERAKVQGEEIIFERGSLLTQREDRTFSADFTLYRLSLRMVMNKEEENPSRRYALASLNLLLCALLMGVAYRLAWSVEHHHRYYYALGVLSVLYQTLLVLVRQKV
ncbi:MAG: LptF/LptG family permease [Aquificaceae bacterium]|nr:LptF/LptG family permease [Aquificaceae bacterium]